MHATAAKSVTYGKSVCLNAYAALRGDVTARLSGKGACRGAGSRVWAADATGDKRWCLRRRRRRKPQARRFIPFRMRRQAGTGREH